MLSTIMFFFLLLLLPHRTSLVLWELIIVIAGMLVIRWTTTGAVRVIRMSPWFLINTADYTKIRHVRRQTFYQIMQGVALLTFGLFPSQMLIINCIFCPHHIFIRFKLHMNNLLLLHLLGLWLDKNSATTVASCFFDHFQLKLFFTFRLEAMVGSSDSNSEE